MPLSLSGTLRDPLGDPLDGARIFFSARTTSEAVLQGVSAEAVTDASGVYSITVEFGYYDIYVQPSSAPYQRIVLARGVPINADITADNLNALLVNWQGAENATPEVLLEIQAAVDEAKGYRDQASTSETNAFNSAGAAASSATEAAANAELAAQNAAALYPSTAEGLAATTNGQYFKVPENGYLQLYRNESGVAAPVLKLASQESLEALNARPDPLLTSLLF